MIPLNPTQLPAQTATWTQGDGTPTSLFYFFCRILYNRTGGQSGIPLTVGAQLTAATPPLGLVNDFNEVTQGSGGVQLAALQPGQLQWVYNGTGTNLNVSPATNGQINNSGGSYSLANGTSQMFWCPRLLTSGGTLYRTVTLG